MSDPERADPPPRATALLLVTVFGLGHLRPAPGTWGSLPSVTIAGALIAAGAGPGNRPFIYLGVLALIAAVFTTACVALGSRAEAVFGRKDPSQVVADETAGQALSLMFIPPAAAAQYLPAACSLAAAFLLFRLLDILKPWPARQIQAVPGGWGIVLDDLVAGLYAGITVWVGATLLAR